MSKRREFHMDLNLTNQCSLRCTYCVETGLFKAKNCDEIIPQFYEWIDRFIVSDFFKASFDVLHISLWGGEPTLEWDTIFRLMERYLGDNRVMFMLYTNGYSVPGSLRKMIVNASELHKKDPDKHSEFRLQVSYDGQPIHDLCRRTVDGKPTADQVLKTLRWAQDAGVEHSVKSTITFDTLKHLYEAWADVNAISSGRYSYFPTLDYVHFATPEQVKLLDGYIEEMKTGMKRIAAALLTAKREGKAASEFRWFRPSRDKCAAGIRLFGLDVDGKIYSCHSAMYSPAKSDHLIGTLADDFSIFEKSVSKHPNTRPAECSSCDAIFCVSCNTTKYPLSSKGTYEERWSDYTVVESSCRVYREMGKVTRAYIQLRDAT
jgi:radical SAM protein with 4Fe4S-binding SPASM domain